MNTKLTKRDKNLLIALAVFLIGTGFVVLIAMPSLNKRNALKTEISQLQEQQVELEDHVTMLPVRETEVSTNQTKRNTCVTDIYPMMESQEIDKMLTNIILSFHLTAKDLTIAAEPERKAFVPYIGSKLAQKPGMKPETDETKQDTADSDHTQKEDKKLDILTSSISVKALGDPGDIQRLIDSLSSQYPAIRITSFTMERKEDQSINVDPLMPKTENATQTTVTLVLELYMCEKEQS